MNPPSKMPVGWTCGGISAPFIRRPIATALLTAAIFLAGVVAFLQLPTAPLPQVDFPTINVSANLPGASPDIMASSVAAPLERQFAHIAGLAEMTSASYLGSTGITLQFDLTRNIDGAARDVQAAINAARANLPSTLPSNPTYRKVNPADAPILILALTSDAYSRGELYDAASTIIQQRLLQIEGVGQVNIGGGALPAVRVEINPTQLNNTGLSLEDVRAMLSQQNANVPKGQLSDEQRTADILANDQLLKAKDYAPLIVAYRNGAPVRLSDIARVVDSVENIRAAGYLNGKPAIPLVIFRQPGANIIQTVDRVKAALPSLEASIPSAINMQVVLDRTQTIRASVLDVERTLVISVMLVVLVVFIFLRNGRATLIPAVVVPTSLIGTFGVMYLCGYSLDNLSLMALTIATGFVVDDAIVVIENISRYLEEGMQPVEAALKGARGRVHCSFDQHFVSGGVYANPADGRHRRPTIPRVRGYALDRHSGLVSDLTNDYTSDVRVFASTTAQFQEAGPDLSAYGRSVREGVGLLQTKPGRSSEASRDHVRCAGGNDRSDWVAFRDNAERLLSATGQRHCLWWNARFAGRVVSSHARSGAASSRRG